MRELMNCIFSLDMVSSREVYEIRRVDIQTRITHTE